MIIQRIVNNLISWINSQNPSVTDNVRVAFDMLATNKNSLCFSFPDTNIGEDTLTDVTGQFNGGYIDVSLYFRDVKGTEGIKDLDAYNFLDNIANYIKKNYTYKVINEERAEWVEKISIQNKAKLIKVYEGNIKDYEVKIRLEYVYKN